VQQLLTLFSLLLISALPAQSQNQAATGVGAKTSPPTETVLYSFTGGSDGGGPGSSLTFDHAGNLYGSTQTGGTAGQGTVFELSPNGSGGWTEAVLYNFCSQPNCSDGGGWNSQLMSPLIFDSLGNLYGTTPGGGANGNGVVYELSPGANGWTESVLHSFAGGADGANPISGVIMDSYGNLYGTTLHSGSTAVGGGTVFELTPSGGGWTEQPIYSSGFLGFSSAPVLNAAGDLFGPAINDNTGGASIYELSPNGSGGWNPAIIYSFPCTHAGCPVGSYPDSALIFDKSGNLYGTALYGGAKNFGTLYKLTLASGKWTGKAIHSFQSAPKDGSRPTGIVFDAAGLNIYGITQQGGKYSPDGTVFESVDAYSAKVLWNFNYTDGDWPSGAPILDRSGNIYGTAFGGGASGHGVVFKVTPTPAAADSSTAKTKTTLTASPTSIDSGQSITFTANVTSQAGTIPDGEPVTFQGTERVILGYGYLAGGFASLTTSAVRWRPPYVGGGPTQGQQIVATYSGDANFSSSKGVTNIVVQRYSISGYLTSTPNPSTYCQPITFTPYVTPSGPYPLTGNVVLSGQFFFPGTGAVGEPRTYKPCQSSGAEYATYYGDPYNDWGYLTGITQVVNPTTTTTSITSSKNPSPQGKAVKFSVVLTAPFATLVEGSVTFTSGTETLGVVSLSDSRGSIVISTLPAGPNTITATYTPGNGNYLASSASLVQVVE
jgi:uncharacterized repeat protein (TIGR03803 family)